ncbi:MAG: SusC/RagA family TonB-linked outer membrane protein [Gemmatimonadota bacterium]
MPAIQRSILTLAFAGLLAFAWAPASLAQTGTITGRVTDVQTLQPLGSAQVSIPQLGVGALTQQNGRFLLINVPAGTHTVTVQRIGYRSADQAVTVVAGASVNQDFAITEEALALDEIIVTGTPGGTRRRAIGNAVTRVEAADIVASRPISDIQDVLQGRSPGVSFTRSSGNVGEGSTIRIRGVSSFNLGSQPLIYVDGIRVDNSTTLGPAVPNVSKTSSASALDDINPDDIESIEIIKGPAAATLYGTEASAGVIQIITKRGNSGAPQFDFGVTQGFNTMQNPADVVGDQFYCTSRTRPCPADALHRFNIFEAEEAAGFEPIGNGHNQGYNLSVRGGSETINYYISGDMSGQTGIVDYNVADRLSGRANLGVLISPELNLNLSLGYTQGETRFASGGLDGGGLWPQMMWASGRGLGEEQRGYLATRPEQFAIIETTRDHARFTGSATFVHNPVEWLTQRMIVGMDRGDEENQILWPRVSGSEAFGQASVGEVTLERPLNTEYTVDYSASANYSLNDEIGLTSSFGAQYFASRFNSVETFGRVFAASAIRSIEGATETSASQSFRENKSLGLYVQQELSYNDRMFLTAAVRGDDNSAFGAEYDAAIYPKLSATWVLSEEPFWNTSVLSSLRLRTAWGKAGRQPGTFDAVTLFAPAVGPGFGPAVTPRARGNADVGPEVSTELEVGFDAGIFNDRISTEFTYFTQRLDDALINVPNSPTSGFPGSETVNAGRLNNHGFETTTNFRVIDGSDLGFDLGFSVAYAMNEVADLGPVEPSNSFRLGYPYPNRTTDIILSAEPNGSGGYNFMCDAGISLAPTPEEFDRYGIERGGEAVPCAQTSTYSLLLGPTFAPWTWNTNATLTMFNNLQVFGLLDAEHGRWINDFNVTCRMEYCGFPNSYSSLARDNPIHVESDLQYRRHPTDSRYAFDSDASYVRLRELGARYTIPQSLLFGADRAAISASARNLWYLWRKQTTMADGVTKIPSPEASDPTSTTGFALFQWPPLTSFEMSLRVSF